MYHRLVVIMSCCVMVAAMAGCTPSASTRAATESGSTSAASQTTSVQSDQGQIEAASESATEESSPGGFVGQWQAKSYNEDGCMETIEFMPNGEFVWTKGMPGEAPDDTVHGTYEETPKGSFYVSDGTSTIVRESSSDGHFVLITSAYDGSNPRKNWIGAGFVMSDTGGTLYWDNTGTGYNSYYQEPYKRLD